MKFIKALSLFLVVDASSNGVYGGESSNGDVVTNTKNKKGTTEFDQDPLLGPYIQKEPHPHIMQQQRHHQHQQLRHHNQQQDQQQQGHYTLVESFDQDPFMVNHDHRRLLQQKGEEDLTIHEKSWSTRVQEQQPEVDPYLQRRRVLEEDDDEEQEQDQQTDQRELKIPVGIPVYNPRLCSTMYNSRPILLPRPEDEEPEDPEGQEGPGQPTSNMNPDGTMTTNNVVVGTPMGGGDGGNDDDGGRRRRRRLCRRRCRNRNLRGFQPVSQRDLEVPPGVIISTTTTCNFCDSGEDPDGGEVPDRGEDGVDDGSAVDPGIPGLPDSPPPPPQTPPETPPSSGGVIDSTPVRPVGIVSIPSTKKCEAEHLMLGCGYNVPAGAVPTSWLPYVGLTTAYTGQVRLQCVCSPKDMDPAATGAAATRQDENLVNTNDEAAEEPELISGLPAVEQEYVFECLVYPLEPLIPEATVPDRDGDGSVDTVTAANIVPSGCTHVDDGICPAGDIPLKPGSTLPGTSDVGCGESAAALDHNSSCLYKCQDGRTIQCMCAGDKTGNNRPHTWYCRNFGL